MSIYEFIEENLEECEQVFLDSGFRECGFEFDTEFIEVHLVKNTRQNMIVKIFEDGTFYSPRSLETFEDGTVLAAIRAIERMVQE